MVKWFIDKGDILIKWRFFFGLGINVFEFII